MFDNILFGFEAVILHMKALLISFLYHQTVLGFVIGFVAATGIYALVLSDEPGHIPRILTRSQHTSFQKIAKQSEVGTFQTSYVEFQKRYNKIKTLFYVAVLAFLLIIGFVLIGR